jgi:hypothetical protein
VLPQFFLDSQQIPKITAQAVQVTRDQHVELTGSRHGQHAVELWPVYRAATHSSLIFGQFGHNLPAVILGMLAACF